MTENPLSHPPGQVHISWDQARRIHALLQTAGFMNEADRLREAMAGSELAAAEGEKP